MSGRGIERDLLDRVDRASDTVTLDFGHGTVNLVHLDKVLWPADAAAELPAYTRRDYIRYLLRMMPHLLTHLRDRPLTLIRQPAGVSGRRFVHFHYEQPLPDFVETIDIYSEKAQVAEQYLLCNNAATLVWLAHTGSLELHPWHSRIDPVPDARDAGTDFTSSAAALERSILNRPDFIVCDLDPYIYSGSEAAGAPPEFSADAFERCKVVAFALKALLDDMGLRGVVKTSGRTGLHVLVPIVRKLTFAAARAFADTLGRHLMREHPGLITLEQRVGRRTGRIFFDANMNARVKTLACPYSVRGVRGAPVAMPLSWAALERAQPLDYTMGNVPDLLEKKGDPWARLSRQDIAKVLA